LNTSSAEEGEEELDLGQKYFRENKNENANISFSRKLNFDGNFEKIHFCIFAKAEKRKCEFLFSRKSNFDENFAKILANFAKI